MARGLIPTPRRVGLLGGECTGKSALAQAIAAELPACIAPEAARDFVVTHGRPPRHGEQADLFRAQQDRVDQVAQQCALPWVVADPVPLVTAVYSVVYFGDDSLLPAGIDDCMAYDAVIWCAPDIDWQPDPGIRDGIEYRDWAHEVIATLVGEIERRGVTLITASGSIEDRMRQCALAWQTSSKQART